MPTRVATALDLAPSTRRGVVETRAGLGGTFAGLGAWAFVDDGASAQLAVGFTWLGAAGARIVSLALDRPRTDWTYWAYLAGEIGLGALALGSARTTARSSGPEPEPTIAPFSPSLTSSPA